MTHPARRPWRGFLVGLALLPLNSLWVLFMESMTGRGPFVSTISLMFNVVFILSFVALANALVRRLRPALALARTDLIIVYVMLVIGTSIVGCDMLQILISVMAAGTWYASQPGAPVEALARTMGNTTPHWLVVSRPEVLYDFYSGDSTLYQWSVVQAWLTPFLWWMGFAVVLVFVMVCLSVILRPLYADRERLTFPIIRLPFELTDVRTPLLRSTPFWVGLVAAGGIHLLNGLNYLYPFIPLLPMYVNVGGYITSAPWSALGWIPLTFYPGVLGLAFLMPVDLLFSCTFFFWWWKALYVLAAVAGSQTQPGPYAESVFPYTIDQVTGACLAVAFVSLLSGKRYFAHVWRRIIGRPSEVQDAGEAMGLRWAALGAVVGVGLLMAFSLHGGMSPYLVLLFFAIYLALSVTIARVRAELGSPVHDFHAAGPDHALSRVIGTINLGPRDLGMLTQYYWFNRAYRAHPIAGSLEGLQLAAWARTSPRPVVWAILLAVVVAMISGAWWWLHLGYRLGTASHWVGMDWFGQEAYARLQSWVESPKPAELVSLLAMGAGFATTLLLALARTRFLGFPLHPVALPIAACWSIHLYWTPMFIAGIVKLLVLRYGGLRLYRRALPLFYGLIVGEALVGCAWPIIGAITGAPIYNAFAW